MSDSTSTKEIVRWSIDWDKPSMTFESTWWILLPLIAIIALYIIYKKRIKRSLVNRFTSATEFTIQTAIFTYKDSVKRNYQNLHIANRIYIELVTRKAALLIDKEKDVIVEIYSSWYTLFKIIREEIKNLPGEFLIDSGNSKKLIDLTIEILNKGLRPHLTKYQADFKKWYDHEINDPNNRNKSPQEIQKGYPKFEKLTTSMMIVNLTLIQYSEQLKKFIDNKK